MKPSSAEHTSLPAHVAQALMRVDERARELPGFQAKLVRLWLDVDTDGLRRLSPMQCVVVIAKLADSIDAMGGR